MELNYDRLVQQTESWLPIVLEYSGKVALALLTLAIGWWLINTLTGRVGGLLARRSVDRTLQGFVGSLVSIVLKLSLIHISEPTRQAEISYAVFCLKKKKPSKKKKKKTPPHTQQAVK